MSFFKNSTKNNLNEQEDLMAEEKRELKESKERNKKFSIGDDRRVKSLSPGALVRRRFFRNKVAVLGLAVLSCMFIFSFIGGFLSPYGQGEIFYRQENVSKDYASAKQSKDFHFLSNDTNNFNSSNEADMIVSMVDKKTQFTSGGKNYTLTEEGKDFFSVSFGGKIVGIAFKDMVVDNQGKSSFDFNTVYNILKAKTSGAAGCKVGEKEYSFDKENILVDKKIVGSITRLILKPSFNGTVLTKDFKEKLNVAIKNEDDSFKAKDNKGKKFKYAIKYDPAKQIWNIKKDRSTRKFNSYQRPSKYHWFGTDVNGMDMLTRLMYGGRVSLVIGFIVEIIAATIGVTMGGVSGYFGKQVDNLIMRIVDVFYCIPSLPIIIILGSVMDALRVNPTLRMTYLMLILGFLGWPGMARLVRGQVLLFREQEFMIATEATGLSVRRRIFKHLVPNVIPQLIVSMTMGLGDTIITEATLSFLGLGVKFPFASWGNIMNDVNNTFVLTNYWFVWIPAGVLLLLTVLAFNLVGDGLRDAFDPRMKR